MPDHLPSWMPSFHRPFYDKIASASINYAHDWVEGQYDPGYPVAITVTTELQSIKATAHGTTGAIPWWGGDTGFSTSYNVLWDGVQPDLEVGDTVLLSINGQTDVVPVGVIDGELDVASDTFEGVLYIPYLTDPVHVDCGVWVDGGPGIGIDGVDPNGGTFTCDFSLPWLGYSAGYGCRSFI